MHAFGYTYDVQQLAKWDRDTAPADLEGANIPALSSSAKSNSPLNKDGWGEYPISFAQSSFEFDNYVVTGNPGTLFVYPRPVQINGINHSPAADGQPGPVYIIYNATSASMFTTQYDTTQNRLVIGLPKEDGMTTCMQTVVRINANGEPVMSGTSRPLPISDNVLVGNDQLAFTATIELNHPDRWTLQGDAVDAELDDMLVTIDAMTKTDTAQNYRLSNPGRRFEKCWGAVKLRTIDHIHILQQPKLNYTYGDTLDLSGLRVRIDYVSDTPGAVEFNVVPYVNAEQFQSHGLYINYWDVGAAVPTTSEERKALVSSYRKASSGDHVTIAPHPRYAAIYRHEFQ